MRRTLICPALISASVIGASLIGLVPVAVEAAPFTDLSVSLPVAPTAVAGSFADYDNDGWPDLMLRRRARDTAVIHNEQGNGFASGAWSFPAAVIDRVGGTEPIPIFADYDNDGDLDAFLAGGNDPDTLVVPDALMRNDQGHFTDVAAEMSLTFPAQSLSSVWLDANGDGWLDLYVSRFYLAPDAAFPPQLYQNLGDGFRDVTEVAGLNRPFPFFVNGHATTAVSGADLTGDGAPDLLLGSFVPTSLLVNDGNGVFFDRTEGSGLPTSGWMADVAVGDIDNDGDLDLFQATLDRDSTLNDAGLQSQSSVLLNLGEGTFLDVTASIGLDQLGDENSGAYFTDIDGDGHLDLMLDSPRSLFMNQGGGLFTPEPVTGISWTDGGIGRSHAQADLDRDGDLDVWWGGTEERLDNETGDVVQALSDGILLRNDTSGNNWLAVELVGQQSNRDGVGARVVATIGNQQQTKEVVSGTGFDQSDRIVHLGLGSHTQVDALTVLWPSGTVDEVGVVRAGGRVRLIEGTGVVHPAPPTIWEIPPPETLTAGQSASLALALVTPLYDPSATITNVTADLSSIGGPTQARFKADGDGVYRWQGDFVAAGEGQVDLSVLIEQETVLGPWWSRLTRSIKVVPAITAVLETRVDATPGESTLAENYPNPFNSGTVIPFSLASPGWAQLTIHDLLGQRVATLVAGHRNAGSYQLRWDATDDAGHPLASGTYISRLRSGDQVQSRKLTLLR